MAQKSLLCAVKDAPAQAELFGARSVRLAAAAAVAGLFIFAGSAHAQQQVGGNGRLRDANNLVGSGGYNGAGSGATLPPSAIGNSIVNGDITAGKAFSGSLPYYDAGQFHGVLPGEGLSIFTANSTGVTTSGVLQDNANQTRIFLGDGRGVTPGSNFVQQGYGSFGYIPSPVVGSSLADPRLGSPSTVDSSGLSTDSIFQAAGSSGTNGRSDLTISPLYGARQLDRAQQATSSSDLGQTAALNDVAPGTNIDISAANRLDGLNAVSNQSLTPGSPDLTNATALDRAPLSQEGLPTTPGNVDSKTNAGTPIDGGQNTQPNVPNGGINPNGTPANGATGANGQGSNGQIGNGRSGSGLGNGRSNSAAINARINAPSFNQAIPSGTAIRDQTQSTRIGGSLQTGEGIQTNVLDTRGSQAPTSAYQRMKQRLLQQNASLTDVGNQNMLQQAQMQDLNARRAAENAPSDNGPGAGAGGGGAPSSGRNSGGFGKTNIPGSSTAAPGTSVGVGPVMSQQIAPVKMQPSDIVLPSLASEEPNKANAGMLAKAESLMKQGKFSSALEEYDKVERVSPHDPFALLGRANAELGATSYGPAAQHLRQAFTNNQELMMARYDLNAFLGADRLQYVIGDLKGIAQSNPSEAGPLFLLAYISYNTNQDRAAAQYLNAAEKREGKPDAFFQELNKRWDLPDVGDEMDK